MQLWLMLKLNIKYTYTVTEGLHKTSHQIADLVCIIDMLGYLVLLLYILPHPGDTNKNCWWQDTWCSVHCPLHFKFKGAIWSSHKHSSCSPHLHKLMHDCLVNTNKKCRRLLKTLVSGRYEKFRVPAKNTPFMQACVAVSPACLCHTTQFKQHWYMWCLWAWSGHVAHRALCSEFSRHNHVVFLRQECPCTL